MVVFITLDKQEDHAQQNRRPHETDGFGTVTFTQRVVSNRHGHA